jgi:hypothetical protein
MFGSGFTLSGLTIQALTAQITGFLNNPFVVASVLAVLALPFAYRIAATIKNLVVGEPYPDLDHAYMTDDQEGYIGKGGEFYLTYSDAAESYIDEADDTE